jgi:Tfp pilus assembly protein PilZ
MVINIPHSDRRLMIDSEVVWVNIHGPDYTETPRGMGVQFTLPLWRQPPTLETSSAKILNLHPAIRNLQSQI